MHIKIFQFDFIVLKISYIPLKNSHADVLLIGKIKLDGRVWRESITVCLYSYL